MICSVSIKSILLLGAFNTIFTVAAAVFFRFQLPCCHSVGPELLHCRLSQLEVGGFTTQRSSCIMKRFVGLLYSILQCTPFNERVLGTIPIYKQPKHQWQLAHTKQQAYFFSHNLKTLLYYKIIMFRTIKHYKILYNIIKF